MKQRRVEILSSFWEHLVKLSFSVPHSSPKSELSLVSSTRDLEILICINYKHIKKTIWHWSLITLSNMAWNKSTSISIQSISQLFKVMNTRYLLFTTSYHPIVWIDITFEDTLIDKLTFGNLISLQVSSFQMRYEVFPYLKLILWNDSKLISICSLSLNVSGSWITAAGLNYISHQNLHSISLKDVKVLLKTTGIQWFSLIFFNLIRLITIKGEFCKNKF